MLFFSLRNGLIVIPYSYPNMHNARNCPLQSQFLPETHHDSLHDQCFTCPVTFHLYYLINKCLSLQFCWSQVHINIEKTWDDLLWVLHQKKNHYNLKCRCFIFRVYKLLFRLKGQHFIALTGVGKVMSFP